MMLAITLILVLVLAVWAAVVMHGGIDPDDLGEMSDDWNVRWRS